MNGRPYVESIDTRVLGGDEHVLPRESALPDGFSGLLLVAIKLRSICQFNTRPRSASGRRDQARTCDPHARGF